jgi:8-oxo-dGTP diphosphatase
MRTRSRSKAETSATLCADVVLFETHDHVLLIKRGWPPYKGAWALPGGHVDVGETFRHAAIRELREETGVEVQALSKVGIYDDPDRDPRGRVVSVAFTAVTPDGARPTAGDDATDAAWIPVSQVISGEVPIAFDHHKIVCDAYMFSMQSGHEGK